MGTAIEAGRALVRVGLDSKGIASDAQKVKSAVSTGLKALGGLTVGVGIFRGLTGALRGMSGALSAAGNTEEVVSNLKIFSGSAERATAIIKKMQAIASSTSLSFGDLQSATTLMSAFGIATDKAVDIATKLGSVALGDGAKMQNLALAMGQVQSKSRLMGGELLQLQNAGFSPLATISRVTGRSMNELFKTMEAGGISSAMVFQALNIETSKGGKFMGILESRAATLNGQLDNLRDTAQLVLAALGKPLLPIAKQFVSFSSQVLGSIRSIAENSPELITAITGVGAAVGVAAGGLVAASGLVVGVSGSYLLVKNAMKDIPALFGTTSKATDVAAVATANATKVVSAGASAMSTAVAASTSGANLALYGLSGSFMKTGKTALAAFELISNSAELAATRLNTQIVKMLASLTALEGGLAKASATKIAPQVTQIATNAPAGLLGDIGSESSKATRKRKSRTSNFADELLALAESDFDQREADNQLVRSAIEAQQQSAFADPVVQQKPRGKFSTYGDDLLANAESNTPVVKPKRKGFFSRVAKPVAAISRTSSYSEDLLATASVRKPGFASKAASGIGNALGAAPGAVASGVGVVAKSFSSVGSAASSAIGGLMTRLAPLGAMFTKVFGAVSAALGGGTIGPILAVAGAVTAATAAIGYLLNKAGLLQPMFESIKATVKQFGDIFSRTFRGISDALGSGEYVLAAKILWSGIKVAFLTAANNLVQSLPTIFQNGFSVVVKLGQAFLQTVVDLFKAIPKLIYASLSGQASIAELVYDIFIGNFSNNAAQKALTKETENFGKLTTEAADKLKAKREKDAKANAIAPTQEQQAAPAPSEAQIKRAEAIKSANEDATKTISDLNNELLGLRFGSKVAKELSLAEAGVSRSRIYAITQLENMKRVLEARQQSAIDITSVVAGESAANKLRLAHEGLSAEMINELSAMDALKVATQERQDLFTEIAGLQASLRGDTQGDMLKRTELERQGLNQTQIAEIMLLRARKKELSELNDKQQKLRDDAKSLTEEFGKNPFQKLKDEITRIKQMQAQGLITGDVAKQAIAAEKQKLAPTIQPQQAIVGRGSSALALFRGRSTRVDEAVKISREQLRVANKQAKSLEKLERKESFVVQRGNF